MNSILAFFFCFLSIQISASIDPAAAGIISGTLATSNGAPAPGYTVDIIGTSHTSTYRMRSVTTETGTFRVVGLNLGEYVVAPYLEDIASRYPAGASLFYNPHPERVQLTADSIIKEIHLRLGPPNRILTGTIRSARDGVPVPAVIILEYPNDSDRFIRFSTSLSGTYRALIPPETQLSITVLAPGYNSQSQSIEAVSQNVDPQIDIKLRPIA